MEHNLLHLVLPRIAVQFPRKRYGYGTVREIAYKSHGKRLGEQVDSLVAAFSAKPQPPELDPALILRVNLEAHANINDEDWTRLGLKLLSVDREKRFILFSSDVQMKEFTKKLALYKKGPKEDMKRAPHSILFSNIDEIAEIQPEDKIGRLLRLSGITSPMGFVRGKVYVVDVQLWDFWNQNRNMAKVREVISFVKSRKGAVPDSFCSKGLNLLRVQCKGSLLKDLIEQVNTVSLVDFPPKPSLTISESLDLSISDFPKVPSPPEHASSVAILDSGIVSGHPFLRTAVGEALAVPRSVGNEVDENGHGTMVAGLALYGDIEKCVSQKMFAPEIRIYSVRVLNRNNEFDEERLIVSQMVEAISYIHDKYGCRVFNLSLGDDELVYAGGKVGPWAAVLDNLCREKNIIIVVSAGNFLRYPTDVLNEYPKYLLSDEAKIIEPATGAIVLTVGSLASRDNVSRAGGRWVDIRPIAAKNQPSPFTRTGPGIGNSIKPELCEYGGNKIFNGALGKVMTHQEMSVVSLNKKYLEKLFGADVGTSFAAPKVAFMAAKLFDLYPKNSANLIRAILSISADMPLETAELLEQYPEDAPFRFCGYGKPDIEFAQASAGNRLMLYNESRIRHNHVHIYRLPIPDEFFSLAGEKRIGVAIAFDPPVRETRIDYLGAKMAFRLLRGTNPDEIVETLRKRRKDEDPIDSFPSKFNCDISPGPRMREGGTLQKGVFTTPNRFKEDYGRDYFLVINCAEKWSKNPEAEQRYAVVVSVEMEKEIDIYNQIKQRITIRVKART